MSVCLELTDKAIMARTGLHTWQENFHVLCENIVVRLPNGIFVRI